MARIVLLSTLCLCFHAFSFAAPQSALFSISFDKSEYSKAEPIYINFELKNTSGQPGYFNRRFYLNKKNSPSYQREVYLFVVAPSGKELEFKHLRKPGLPRTGHFVFLKPGERAAAEKPQNIQHFFDFSESGTYKLIATYENSCGEEIGLDVFSEKITSQPATIRIR